MLVPEEPVTSDPDHPMTGAVSNLDQKSSAVVLTPRSSSDWEEPHPGQRCPVPPAGTASNGLGDSQTCNGAPKGIIMAAKAFAPYPKRGWATTSSRRFLRPRLRTATLKPLKIPATPKEAGVRISYLSTQSNSSSLRPLVQSPAPTPMLERISNTRTVSPMYGCETGKVAVKHADDSGASSAESALSSTHSSMRVSTTDFLGHMPPSSDPEESDRSSCMSLEPDTSPDSLSPDEDPYGWESELDRKIATGDISCCPTFQYRRAGGGKRSLLQKVLSLGPRDFSRSAAMP